MFRDGRQQRMPLPYTPPEVRELPLLCLQHDQSNIHFMDACALNQCLHSRVLWELGAQPLLRFELQSDA